MITVAGLVPYVVGALVLGGIAVLLSRRREYMLRWCAWVVGVSVVVGALYLGPGGAAVLAGVVGVVCVLEYGTLTRLPVPDRVAMGVAVAGLAISAWLVPAELPRVLIGGLLVVALVPVITGDAEHGLRRASLAVLGTAWLASLTGVVLLGPAVLALFAAVSVADIVALFAGQRLGGPKLSPLSPGKHWSGTLAGVAAGVATLAALGALTPSLTIAVALGAPLGDLFESMLKRGLDAKDSGAWLAGAGGLLDRVDSLLFALALAIILQ